MEESSLEKLEAGVDRLLDAYGRLKSENIELREKLSVMEAKTAAVTYRLDSIIARLEGAKEK